MERVRGLPRVEAALLAVALVAAVAVFWFSGEAGDVRQEDLKLQAQLVTLQDDRADFTVLIPAKEAELEAARLEAPDPAQSTPTSQPFPPREEALDLSGALAKYAGDQGLRLNSFSSTLASATFGGREYPAISYSMEAQGTASALVGILRVVGLFPTAQVQSLEFSREPDSDVLWDMDLTVVVAFAGEVSEES